MFWACTTVCYLENFSFLSRISSPGSWIWKFQEKGGHFLDKHFEYPDPYVILKNAVLIMNISNLTTWRGKMGQKLHFSWQQRDGCTQNICQKMTPFFSWNFSNPTTWEKKYGTKIAVFKITYSCGYSKHSPWKTQSPFCLAIVQIWLLGQEIWGKNCLFQDNIGLWVLKMFVYKPRFCFGIFQIQLLGKEIQGKNCIFQDNIGVRVLQK